MKLLKLLCLSFLFGNAAQARASADAKGLAYVLVSPELEQAKTTSSLNKRGGRFDLNSATVGGSSWECLTGDLATEEQMYEIRFSNYGTRFDEIFSVTLFTTYKNCDVSQVQSKSVVITRSRLEEIDRSVEKGGYSGAGGK